MFTFTDLMYLSHNISSYQTIECFFMKIVGLCYLQGFHRNSGLRFTYGNDPEIFSISMYGKGSGKPEFRNDFQNDFFPLKRKFPEHCSGIMECSGNFRNIVPEIFPKIVPEISGFWINWYHNYIKVLCKYNTSQ